MYSTLIRKMLSVNKIKFPYPATETQSVNNFIKITMKEITAVAGARWPRGP